ncbi:hypothetical protein GCM10010289_63490 [Streptomyces violascens]|nr:hypothetical protein GCM10010289_63490 [Streptomyces violascens]
MIGLAFMRNDKRGSRQHEMMADTQGMLRDFTNHLREVSFSVGQGDKIAITGQPLVPRDTINTLLAYTNFIPGATAEAAGVGGSTRAARGRTCSPMKPIALRAIRRRFEASG